MKRTFATAALVIALVVQVAHAAPAQAVASLRAMTCCARGCDHARSLSDAMRCCGVRAGDDLAVTPHANTKLVPTFVAQALGAPAISGDALVASSSMHETPRHERPPPVFLLVRSLRL